MSLPKIKNKIKIPISLAFLFIIITAALTACGGNDSNTDPVKKQLKTITIERTFTELDGLNANEALSNITFELKAIGHYNDGSSDNITALTQWISSDPAIANFNDSSLLHTNKLGKINVTAKVKNVTAVWPLSILEPVAITITPSLKSADFDNNQMAFVPKGTSITLDTIVEWSDHSKRNGNNYISWMQNDTSFAQDFSEKNRFRAVGNFGEITSLTASFHGVSSNVISLEVSDATLKNITIKSTNTSQSSDVLYGTSREFTAIGTYQVDSKTTKDINITKDVEWISNAPNIFYNINNSNIFTAYSGTANSNATISAKMFNIKSNQQELTIADATLESIEIVGPDKSDTLINGIETSLSATGHYTLASATSNSITGLHITADLTSFVSWSSSDQTILKQTGYNTFLPQGNFKTALITAEVTDNSYSTTKRFNINAGTLTNITISEIHQYPLIVPLKRSRTFKAMGDYITEESSDVISLDITNNVNWHLDQEQAPNSFVQAENNVIAQLLTDTPVTIYATSSKITSNKEALTSINVRKEFSVMGTTFSLSELMFDGNTPQFVNEDGTNWGVDTWQQSNISCQHLGRRLATEHELNILQTAIDDLKEAYGWAIYAANYWTSTVPSTKTNTHISKDLTHTGESYTEEDATFNFSVCVSETN
ncbi:MULTISPECIES: hypothetical protein [unclassified Photobacterium]|uniref:hypothetical protein n=1 Tax=unclassified Photobacterium TaxID=2628852 RepID=UPI001EE0E627|nr:MULTISPECIES: hypothetical protein [unclassified Photobacterium]MCG3865618.1 hypothetical protein [Photobacterium sp. Ph6]MCG3877119.1 hypothetical protein [Photobacterium sp. Ph5]